MHCFNVHFIWSIKHWSCCCRALGAAGPALECYTSKVRYYHHHWYAVPRESWTLLCNRGSLISRSLPWAVWRIQNHISWCFLGARCHQNSEYYLASGLDVQPDKEDRQNVLVNPNMDRQHKHSCKATKTGVSSVPSSCLTPWECKYSTVLLRVQMMSDTSLSVKFGSVRALSSSSSPLSNSWTRKTHWPSSNT